MKKISRNAVLATVASIAFLVVCMFGEGAIGGFGFNAACYKYLGCTTGFFGYDAMEHFLSGLAIAWLLVWFFKKYPQYSLLHSSRWKNILVLFGSVALILVAWELMECAHDYFRLEVLHQPLFNVRLHLNRLDQPSNFDTMGDMAFSLFGGAIALLFSEVRKPNG